MHDSAQSRFSLRDEPGATTSSEGRPRSPAVAFGLHAGRARPTVANEKESVHRGLFRAQRDAWIEPRCANARQQAGGNPDQRENNDRAAIDDGIRRLRLEQQL